MTSHSQQAIAFSGFIMVGTSHNDQVTGRDILNESAPCLSVCCPYETTETRRT